MTPDLLYVSWGGTGRAASVRAAMKRAIDTDRSLTYLAVLDDDHFDDLDQAMVGLVASELMWLLDAQLDLTRSQLGAPDLKVSVDVAAGQVVDLVSTLVAEIGQTEILIGAPVPVAGHASVDSLIAQLAKTTGCPVELVVPD